MNTSSPLQLRASLGPVLLVYSAPPELPARPSCVLQTNIAVHNAVKVPIGSLLPSRVRGGVTHVAHAPPLCCAFPCRASYRWHTGCHHVMSVQPRPHARCTASHGQRSTTRPLLVWCGPPNSCARSGPAGCQDGSTTNSAGRAPPRCTACMHEPSCILGGGGSCSRVVRYMSSSH